MGSLSHCQDIDGFFLFITKANNFSVLRIGEKRRTLRLSSPTLSVTQYLLGGALNNVFDVLV